MTEEADTRPDARGNVPLTASLWRIDLVLDEAGRETCFAALSDDERARADRFLRQEDRDRYAGCHAALRRILSGALETDPLSIRFCDDGSGKPELDDPWRGALRFNLSHSGQVGLIGVSATARIGVDVEWARPIADCLGLARSHFAPAEVAALEALPTDACQAGFYACWTRKEAFVKALGLGLSFPLHRFVVSVPPTSPALLSIDGSQEAARGWTLHHLDLGSGHVGAVVIEQAGARIDLRSLERGWATARS
jgi:4'-phosphopantetheinyl transferase